ncbi:(Fe-S)-binding protein [Nonomuraea indica]|uniref:Glycolate oxidase iron-sulfur subunit n=1 Tax=Nonomuraea indica TaxID=1581193 RepID=A0ABW8AC21_9ACTN
MTGFTPDLLNRCISCGFCLPACPTYALTKDETSSPRGRINLMRALDEGTLPADDLRLREEASFCLGCRACETVCPAGVRYGALLEEWRDRQWQGTDRPLVARLLMFAVNARWRVRLLGLLRRHARTRAKPAGPHLMLGCFERALYPRVSRAALRLLPDLAAPASQGCCGALHAHNGDSERGQRMAVELGERLPGTIVTTSGGCAAHLADALGRDRVKELSEYVTSRPPTSPPPKPSTDPPPPPPTDHPPKPSTSRQPGPPAGRPPLPSAGCEPGASGGRPLEPPGGRPAGSSAGRLPASFAGPPAEPSAAHGMCFGPLRGKPLRIGLQDSCHLRNGLGVWREPRALLERIGEYVELPSAGTCCGAAGSYALVRPRDSRRVLDAKLDEIEAAGVDYVAVVNPGCYRQLAQGLRRRRSAVRAVHLAELLTTTASTTTADSHPCEHHDGWPP